MEDIGRKIIFIIMAVLFIMVAITSLLRAASLPEKEGDTARVVEPAMAKDAPDSRLNRIDFGNTYIIGQTIKSGAVYLLQRKKSEIKSMLKYREDYRDEILEGFLSDSFVKKDSGEQEETQRAKRDSRCGERLVTQE